MQPLSLTVEAVGEHVTASEIGALFARARSSHIESVRYLLEAGQRLTEQKAALPPGEWLLWVKEHESDLGFGARTAQKLMHGYATLTAHELDDDSASALNRLIWCNEHEPSPYPAGPPVAYIARTGSWPNKHDPSEFDGLSDEQWTQVLEATAKWVSWLQRLAARRSPQLTKAA